jgi:hypothetical protein
MTHTYLDILSVLVILIDILGVIFLVWRAVNKQTTLWGAAAIATNLGHTKAAIDTAISNLITKFGQTTAQIYADATIEADFAVLKDCIDAWKNQ